MICQQLTQCELGPDQRRTHLDLIIYTFYNLPLPKACSVDPDEKPRFAASHLGLWCLYMLLFRMHSARFTHFRLATPLLSTLKRILRRTSTKLGLMCLAQGPQRSDAGEARTRGLSVSSQALYH